MRFDLDPAELSPDEQVRELAAILALGLRRLRDHTALTSATQNPLQNVDSSLAIPGKTSVTVTPG